MMNSFGSILRLTTFGESHGPAIGGILDGVPAGCPIDEVLVQQALDLRRPGGSAFGSARRESDRIQLLSGIFEGKTLGTPIGFIIPNTDARSADYERLRHVFRPNHADFTYQAKYGIRDYRGGGRASARETACRVAAGAIAAQILAQRGIFVTAYTSAIGNISYHTPLPAKEDVYRSDVRCPGSETAEAMHTLLKKMQADHNTIGGTVSCVVTGVPTGLGEPVFGKLQALLASAMMSIPAAKGFEYGLGFKAAKASGTDAKDVFVPGNEMKTASNNSGGIQGGISNGSEIYFTVAFKPAPTLLRPVQTVDEQGNEVTLTMSGRHDPCVVPRAVPVVEAMTCLVLLDAILMQRTNRF